MLRNFYFITLIIFVVACTTEKTTPARFSELAVSTTNIDFVNKVENTEQFNIFSYRNFYNGAGVGIGDFNNDGLEDIYLTSNMGSNKLYLNEGGFQFKDITEKAGIGLEKKWSTGVSIVDLNSDGLLDIYVCNAGIREDGGQENSLFINKGDLTFQEVASKYGLDENGYTTHAAFFDYDLDGDLDVYILNNSFIPVNTLNYSNKRDLRAKDWPIKEFLQGGGDKLLKNENGKFVDVSEETGIYGSLIGFGLGVTVGDVNGDFYPDLYISNDFFERDYLYINQQNGTFKEDLENWFKHISLSSMGADLGDINNDGYPELFVTDMLPDDDYRLKTTSTFENINVHDLKLQRGFYHQYMQNTLQLNNQNGRYHEISQFAGVAASDWSWGALMWDADNDGHSDIFVCNGIYHDVTNQDFIDFFANDVIQEMVMTGEKQQIDSIINRMPSVPIPNKAFKNQHNLKFADVSQEWGFEKPTFSNGAAYSDLDNDGDLDLVINNVNQPTLVYQNNTSKEENTHHIGVHLVGKKQNSFGLGASIFMYSNSEIQYRYHLPMRGFQSSMSYRNNFGLGNKTEVDSIVVVWADQSKSKIINPPIDTLLQISQNKTVGSHQIVGKPTSTIFQKEDAPFLQHQEDNFNDFYMERNIPLSLAEEGPAFALGDVNADGLQDIFIGGAAKQVGQLYLGSKDGFQQKLQADFETDAPYEDIASILVDIDGDQDLDLYVGSGGNNGTFGQKSLEDRLYLNDGKGNFTSFNNSLPKNLENTSCIAPNDVDGDGDIDLFVGSRASLNNYGYSPNSNLLLNDGKGNFSNAALEKRDIGMITKAIWIDLMDDNQKELLLIGEWMSPKIFRFIDGKLEQLTSNLSDYSGWWYEANTGDFDGDGDMDLFLGNVGENFYLKTAKTHPLKLWMYDFDKNGSPEKIISKTLNNKDVPVVMKKDLAEQLPSMKKKNVLHEVYASRGMKTLFAAKNLENATIKEANYFQSVIAINKGNGEFSMQPMTASAQLSCISASTILDIDQDGDLDLITGGNRFEFLPQYSRLDASVATLWENQGKGVFTEIPDKNSGLEADKEVKSINWFQQNENWNLLIIQNNERPQLYIKKTNSL